MAKNLIKVLKIYHFCTGEVNHYFISRSDIMLKKLSLINFHIKADRLILDKKKLNLIWSNQQLSIEKMVGL